MTLVIRKKETEIFNKSKHYYTSIVIDIIYAATRNSLNIADKIITFMLSQCKFYGFSF